MYELIQLGGGSHYIECPAKIGLWADPNGKDVVLVDSGGDKSAGRKVRQVLDAQGWQLRTILNTHSHADHCGGNQYLQKQTGCRIYAPAVEAEVVRHPILEPALLYGGNPYRELHHKFLMAEESLAEDLPEPFPLEGWQVLREPGHSVNLCGYVSPDGAAYVGDCITSQETMDKYGVFFLWDPGAYIETLERLRQGVEGVRWWVPSHTAVLGDAEFCALAEANIAKVREIADRVEEICAQPLSFDTILQRLFAAFDMRMNCQQHALIGSTLHSYLTWMKDSGRLEVRIEDNLLLWARA